MSVQDKLTTFADATAAGDTGTRVIGDVIDLKALGSASNAGLNSNLGGLHDVGAGQPVYLQVTVDEAFLFAGTTDHSYVLKFVTSDTTDMTNSVTLATSTDPATTDIAVGTMLWQTALPSEGPAYKRYIALKETVVGTTSTGKINAAITLDPRSSLKVYPQADVGF